MHGHHLIPVPAQAANQATRAAKDASKEKHGEPAAPGPGKFDTPQSGEAFAHGTGRFQPLLDAPPKRQKIEVSTKVKLAEREALKRLAKTATSSSSTLPTDRPCKKHRHHYVASEAATSSSPQESFKKVPSEERLPLLPPKRQKGALSHGGERSEADAIGRLLRSTSKVSTGSAVPANLLS